MTETTETAQTPEPAEEPVAEPVPESLEGSGLEPVEIEDTESSGEDSGSSGEDSASSGGDLEDSSTTEDEEEE